MQNASQAYRDSIEHSMMRNRGYIKVSLGIINQLAQSVATVQNSNLFYFSGGDEVFSGAIANKVYATAEQNFAKVDGSMYFAPSSGSSSYYFQGAVSNNILGAIRIDFRNTSDLDIKGFTIDFGDAYPTRFTIQTNAVTKSYDSDSRYFTTEDTFNGTNYIIITPVSMVNGQNRFRILSLICGIANTFSNEEIISYSSKEYVSPICDSLPSMDMSITIDNQDQYYNPDNPDSALAYMEVGQEMTVQFGYDVDGTGNIEWLPSQIAHLKTWSATDTDAKFTAVDKFDYLLNENYRKGQYSVAGITLYALAERVLQSAHITDYSLDSYLRSLTVHNPLPNVKHSECLQIIANAGRCCLYIDRNDVIHIDGNFLPDSTATVLTGGQAEYSNVSGVLSTSQKAGYANASQGFSIVDGSLYFLPTGSNYLETGYVSGNLTDSTGNISCSLQITFEVEAPIYGVQIKFRETAAKDFVIAFYDDNNVNVKNVTVSDNELLEWYTNESCLTVKRMVVSVSKGLPNTRIFIDNISFDNTSDYTISRMYSITGSPTATRENRVQSISVAKHTYSNSTEAIKLLKSETVIKASGATVTKIVEFGNPSYGYQVSVKSSEGGGYNIAITESGAYYVLLTISGAATLVQYEISGYEYVVTDSYVTNNYHASGDLVTWDNPLISSDAMAQSMADWLGDYYMGDVTYQIPWRGDPRVDANDLFWLELKTESASLVRAYQNELSFNGAWSGTLQARNYKQIYKGA